MDLIEGALKPRRRYWNFFLCVCEGVIGVYDWEKNGTGDLGCCGPRGIIGL